MTLAMFFAVFEIGSGTIAINATNTIWNNRSIGCYDHAYLLKKLVNVDGKVWFVIDDESPSLFRLVWSAAPLIVSATVIAILFWLWFVIMRFGPIFPQVSLDRRSFAEHISANASFLWRFNLQGHLIEQLRKEIAHVLDRRMLGFEALTDAEKITNLEKLCSLEQEELFSVYLKPLQEIEKREFVYTINRLKLIKDQL